MIHLDAVTNDDQISQQELEQDIVISEELVLKIKSCLDAILMQEENESIKFYSCQDNHRVFTLNTASEFIFKMKADGDIQTADYDDSVRIRYQKMVRAQTLIRTYKLGLLALPRAKLFSVDVEGKEYDIIAERKLDINTDKEVQERYFEEYANRLDESIRQLALFICKTGYSDVEYRNNPVMNSFDEKGNCKIALIDIEEMYKSEIGLFGGGFRRTGLVGLVNEVQCRIIEGIALQNNINITLFPFAFNERKKVLEEKWQLNQFYAKNGIASGNELLEVDIDTLDLDLTRRGILKGCKSVSVRKIVLDVINQINRLITANSKKKTIRERRFVILDIFYPPFNEYEAFSFEEGDESQKCLPLIIKSLIDKGHLFKLQDIDDRGYFIQA